MGVNLSRLKVEIWAGNSNILFGNTPAACVVYTLFAHRMECLADLNSQRWFFKPRLAR